MYEQLRLPLRSAFHEGSCSCSVSFQALILAHCPGNQRLVEVPENRIDRRRTEFPVVAQPASQDWVVQAGDVSHADIRPGLVARLASRLPPGLEGRRTHGGGEVPKYAVAVAVLHDSP